MGLFLQTAIVPGCDEKTARAVLEGLAPQKDWNLNVSECRFAPNDKGVQIFFNDWCSGYEEMAADLSKELGRAVLLPYIYDGDFWGYFFCENGVLTDQFMPIPEYFSDDPAKAVPAPGNAALIAERFHVPEETVAPYLTSWALDELDGAEKADQADEFPYGDCWQMVDFMAKLGWPWPWD